MSHAVVLVVVDGPMGVIEEQTVHQMAPFDENGEWFVDGSRWDWYVIGGRWNGMLGGADVLQRKDLDIARLRKWQEQRAARWYADVQEGLRRGRQPIFDDAWKPGMTEADYIAAHVRFDFPAPHAFLRNRHWYEQERLGWFGGTARTECEIHHGADEQATCVTRNGDAAIFTFNKPEEWDARFFTRFISQMDPEKFMVIVDYHV